MWNFIETMPEPILALLSVIVGGMISAGTAYLAQSAVERRARNDFLIRRLEEIYTGCQTVHDGHKARTEWLSEQTEIRKDDWKAIPEWPGSQMSGIKMAVRGYVPHLGRSLAEMAEAHQWFKDLNSRLRKQIETGGTLR